MGALEIVLLLGGAIIFIISFVLPQSIEKPSEESKKLAREEIRLMVSEEMNDIKSHVDNVVDEAVGYAVDKTERSLERLTNEKIMAVSEYSDTVIQEIHRNHEEAVFLYDMLNSKHVNLKDTVSMVDKTVKEAFETTKEVEAAVNSFQKLAPANAVSESVNQVELKHNIVTSQVQKEDDLDSEKQVSVKIAEENDTASNNNERILKLYRQGCSSVVIAKELGLGVGEVKLVIDLYKNM
ncbi:MAG: hypothetical protein IJF07_04635 [Lachnospiraceae bacterium]|nr:hypothetical protein [Lachnospiraceae bacterium]